MTTTLWVALFWFCISGLGLYLDGHPIAIWVCGVNFGLAVGMYQLNRELGLK